MTRFRPRSWLGPGVLSPVQYAARITECQEDPASPTRSAWPPRAGRRLPVEIHVSVPSVARIYDYVLGGKENFASDRAAADALLRSLPEAREPAVENRAFLRRAVRFLVGEAGIRQILDIGSGLPTAGNVHEVAHAIDPSVRVV